MYYTKYDPATLPNSITSLKRYNVLFNFLNDNVVKITDDKDYNEFIEGYKEMLDINKYSFSDELIVCMTYIHYNHFLSRWFIKFYITRFIIENDDIYMTELRVLPSNIRNSSELRFVDKNNKRQTLLKIESKSSDDYKISADRIVVKKSNDLTSKAMNYLTFYINDYDAFITKYIPNLKKHEDVVELTEEMKETAKQLVNREGLLAHQKKFVMHLNELQDLINTMHIYVDDFLKISEKYEDATNEYRDALGRAKDKLDSARETFNDYIGISRRKKNAYGYSFSGVQSDAERAAKDIISGLDMLYKNIESNYFNVATDINDANDEFKEYIRPYKDNIKSIAEEIQECTKKIYDSDTKLTENDLMLHNYIQGIQKLEQSKKDIIESLKLRGIIISMDENGHMLFNDARIKANKMPDPRLLFEAINKKINELEEHKKSISERLKLIKDDYDVNIKPLVETRNKLKQTLADKTKELDEISKKLKQKDYSDYYKVEAIKNDIKEFINSDYVPPMIFNDIYIDEILRTDKHEDVGKFTSIAYASRNVILPSDKYRTWLNLTEAYGAENCFNGYVHIIGDISEATLMDDDPSDKKGILATSICCGFGGSVGITAMCMKARPDNYLIDFITAIIYAIEEHNNELVQVLGERINFIPPDIDERKAKEIPEPKINCRRIINYAIDSNNYTALVILRKLFHRQGINI